MYIYLVLATLKTDEVGEEDGERFLCADSYIAAMKPDQKQPPMRKVVSPESICSASAFYKGESQEKNFPGDWKQQRFLLGSPAQVMLGGSWGPLFSQIHVAAVTTSAASDATSSTVAIKMQTMVLSEARGL